MMWKCLLFMCCLLVSVVGAVYTESSWLALKEALQASGKPLSALRMLEFGSQYFCTDGAGGVSKLFAEEGHLTSTNVAKYFFRHLGVNHTSVDLNEWDSAIPLDCSEDITHHFAGEPHFDIITNLRFSHYIGQGMLSSEVLRAQYNFWKNMHDLGAEGSLYMHELVITSKGMVDTGVCHHTLNFVEELAQLCGYELLPTYSLPPAGHAFEYFLLPVQGQSVISVADGVETHTVFLRKKESREFISFDIFAKLSGITVLEDREIIRVLLSLANETILTVSLDSTEVNLADWSRTICRDLFSAVNESKCVNFVQQHLATKTWPYLARPSSHDNYFEYGVIDYLLMGIS